MISRAPRDPIGSRVLSYAIALAAIAFAVAVRWALDPWLGDALPLVTLYGAVAAAVWWGGWRPGLFAAVVGGLACQYLFVPPRGVLDFSGPGVAIGTVAYLATCTVLIGFGHLMRRAQFAAYEQRESCASLWRASGTPSSRQTCAVASRT